MGWEQIKELVQQCANEQIIQAAMKKDLEPLAYVLAPSVTFRDEYIAFSEFPVGEGKVDFVVFNDRSRMHIYFIEVKGANFHFVNSDGSIHADINEAAKQVRERITETMHTYHDSRYRMHQIREDAEAGRIRYNSHVGTGAPLKVDPQKDICLFGVVIGGTTRDDREESRLRHQWEADSVNIRFESWNSWLRKCL